MRKKNRVVGMIRGRCIRRLASWLLLSLAAVALFVLAETVFFRLRYPHFPKQACPQKVSVSNLAVAPSGAWSISRVTFQVENCALPHVDAGICQSRSVSDAVVLNLCTRTATRLHIEGSHLQHMAVSPTSGDVAIACEDRCIRFFQNLSGHFADASKPDIRLRTFAYTAHKLQHPTFSCDGRLLLAVSNCCLCAWQWNTGKLLYKQPLPDEFFKPQSVPDPWFPRPSLSCDGRCLLSSPLTGEVCLWDADTGRKIKTITPGEGHIKKAILSPDGELVAFYLSGPEVKVCRVESGEKLWRDAQSSFPGILIAFSPCSRFFARTSHDDGCDIITVFEATTGRQVCKWYENEAPITGLTMSAGGVLYSINANGGIRAWNLEKQREEWSLSMLDRCAVAEFFSK